MNKESIIYEESIMKNLENKSEDTKKNYYLYNFLYDKKMYKKMIDYQVLPYRLELEPSTRCCLKCKYCQVANWDRKSLPDMSMEIFTQIINKMPHILELKLQGQGEPLLNEKFFDMVEYAVKNRIIVRYYTNGVLLNSNICRKIIDSGTHELRISLDGSSKETVEKIRQGIDFNQVLNNIKTLIEMRSLNFNKQMPFVNIWMLVSKINYKEILSTIELSKKLGVDGVKIQIRPNFRPDKTIIKAVEEDTLDINSKEFINILEEARKIAKELNISFEVYNNLRTADNSCHWLWHSSIISSDGYLLPCTVINNPEIMNFGNILKTNIKDIINGDNYNNFRNQILKFDFSNNSYCSRCFKK